MNPLQGQLDALMKEQGLSFPAPPPGFELEGPKPARPKKIPPPPPGFELEQNVPPPPPGFTLESDLPNPVLQNIAEVPKGIAPGAVKLIGSSIEGAPGLDPMRNITERIDRYRTDMHRVPQMSDAEVETFRAKLKKEIGLSTAYDMLDRAIIDMRMGELSPEQFDKDFPVLSPITETGAYKVGKKVTEFGDKMLPAAPGYENSPGRITGEGLGSVLGGVAATLLDPMFAAALFTASGSGQAVDSAVEAGATPGQQQKAAALGSGPGATDVVPIEILLTRFKVPAALRGPIANGIAKIGTQAFVEGMQEGGQQFLQNLIAKETYNPDQDLMEGVTPNAAGGAGVGALVEGGVQVLETAAGGGHHRVRHPKTPSAAAELPAPPEGYQLEPPPRALPAPPRALPAPAAATVDEGAILQAAGWTPEQIADMDATERQSAVQEAQSQGVRAAQPALPPPQSAVPAAPAPRASAVQPPDPNDNPTAEPVTDIQAQAADLVNEQSPRRGVWLPPASVEHLQRTGALDGILDKGVVVRNFDGQGGILVARDAKTAKEATAARDGGTPIQAIVGTLTGAGTGKPPVVSAVVQQKTPEGAVTRESAVQPQETAARAAQFEAPGRTVEVVLPAQVIQRRAEQVQAEQMQAAAPTDRRSLDDIKEEIFRELVAQTTQTARNAVAGTDGRSWRIKKDGKSFMVLQMPQKRGETPTYFRAPEGATWSREQAVQEAARLAFNKPAPTPATPSPAAAAEPTVPVERQERAPAPKREKVRRPPSLLEFIAGMGGIRDETGELKAMGADKKFVPGSGRIVRETGLHPDKVREAAAEAGYLGDHKDRAVAETTMSDLYDAIGEEMGGTRRYSIEDQAQAQEYEAQREEKATRDSARNRIENELAEHGAATDDKALIDRAVEAMIRDDLDPADAIERASIELEGEEIEPERKQAGRKRVGLPPGWEGDGDTKATAGTRAGVHSAERDRAGAAEERAQESGEPLPDSGEGQGTEAEARPERVTTERTQAGEQAVLPGAERISQKEEAQRAADKPLRSAVAQKPADEGLFGDESQQSDLVDQARKPPKGVARQERTAETVRLSADERQKLEADLRSIVSRVAGRKVRVAFEDQMRADDSTSSEYRQDMESAAETGDVKLQPTIGGLYGHDDEIPGGALIRLALADPAYSPRQSAAHEAFHHFAFTLATDTERKLLENQRTRMEDYLIRKGYPEEYARSLPQYEVEAIAFDRYFAERDGKGLHPGLRRLFDKIGAALRQIKALLGKRGITKYEDLFADVLAGKAAAREEAGRGSFAAGNQQPTRDQTETPAFKKWFGKSKVVDQNGDPEIVYHGTGQQFDAFSKDAEPTNYETDRGLFHFTNVRGTAEAYAQSGGAFGEIINKNPRIISAYVSLQNPLIAEVTSPIEEWDSSGDAYLSQARRDGYDGIILQTAPTTDNRFVEKLVIAFEPTQIKSATGNSGAFDPNNPSIVAQQSPVGVTPENAARLSFVGARSQNILDRMGYSLDMAREKIEDRWIWLKRIQEDIEKRTGVTLPESLDAYVAQALSPKANENLLDLRRQFIEPLVEKMQKAEITVAELDRYLTALHAPERNAVIRQRDPQNNSGSGMTDAEAANVVRSIPASKRASYEDLADMVRGLVHATRAELVRSGLISRDTANEWAAQYKNYVPLRGFEADPSEEGPRTGRGYDIRGKETKAATGRHSKSDSPLAYTIMQAEQAIVRAEKNRVLKTLLRLVQARPDPEIWDVAQGRTEKYLDDRTGMVKERAVHPSRDFGDPSLFGVKIGGKTTFLEIKHPGLQRALRGMTPNENGLVKAVAKAARFYAQLVTQWNPEFVPTNMMRDVQTALVNIGDTENLPKGIRTKMFRDALSTKSIRGILSALRDPASSKRYAQWFEEYRHAGGKVSFGNIQDVDQIKKSVEAMLKAGRLRQGITRVGRLIEDLNTAVENGIRLSAYIAMREAGISQSKAAYTARNLTVDFNRRGSWSPLINSLYLFFNASVQGGSRMARAFARSKNVRIATAAIFAAGAGLDWLNSLLAGDDDDGANAYDAIPWWVKERNLIVMTGGKNYIKIPLPYGYNLPFVAGQNMAATMRGANSVAESAGHTLSAAINSFSPLGSAPSFLQFISPTMIDPFVQSAENKSWTGGKIYPTKYDDRLPDSENYFKSAPDWAKTVARILNSSTGGSPARPGLVDVSPETLELYADFAMGGAGKFLIDALTTGQNFLQGEEWVPEKMPMLRRFYGTVRWENEFYDLWDKVDSASYEVKRLGKLGDRDGANAAREKYKQDLGVYPIFKRTKEALKDLGDVSRKAEADGDKDRKKQIDERKEKLIDDALRRYREAHRGG